jgi:hypothetical protein
LAYEDLDKGFRANWGGNLIVILISLLVALVVWGVLKLSLQYRYVFHYNVELTAPMEGHVFQSTSQDPLAVRGASSGFYLLRHKYFASRKGEVLSFRAEPTALRPVPGKEDAFYILTSQIKDRAAEKLDGYLTIDEIVSDTLVFIFPKAFQKKVPVCLKADLSFKPQYMPLDRVSVKPDSILVNGQESIVKTIDSVFTEKISARSLKRSIQGEADIEPIAGVQMSETKIVYHLSVGRYVGRSMDLPVEVRGQEEGSRMILVPSSVTITFKEQYGRKRNLSPEDFSAYVDYSQAVSSSSGKAKVLIDKSPAGVYELRVEPAFLDRVVMLPEEGKGPKPEN